MSCIYACGVVEFEEMDHKRKEENILVFFSFFLLRRVTAVIDGALHIWKIDENLKIYSKDFIHTTYLVVEMRNTFPALIFFQGQAPLPGVCPVVRGDDKSVFLMSSSPAFYRRK